MVDIAKEESATISVPNKMQDLRQNSGLRVEGAGQGQRRQHFLLRNAWRLDTTEEIEDASGTARSPGSPSVEMRCTLCKTVEQVIILDVN